MQKSVVSKQCEKPFAYFSNKATIVSFIMATFVISIHASYLRLYGLEDGKALNLSDKDQKWLGLKDTDKF